MVLRRGGEVFLEDSTHTGTCRVGPHYVQGPWIVGDKTGIVHMQGMYLISLDHDLLTAFFVLFADAPLSPHFRTWKLS